MEHLYGNCGKTSDILTCISNSSNVRRNASSD